MKKQSYLTRATRRFLDGTRHSSPVDAVLAGVRTLDEWALILQEERELEGADSRKRSGVGHRSQKRRISEKRRRLKTGDEESGWQTSR
jgi:hypothetical protein